jgi:hypothetical protein
MSPSDKQQAQNGGQQAQNGKKSVYFRPGQVMLLVDHPPPDDQPGTTVFDFLLKNPIVQKYLSGHLDDQDHIRIRTFERHRPADADKQEPRRFPFPTRDDQPLFSLVTIDVSDSARDRKALKDLIDSINRDILDSQLTRPNRDDRLSIVAAAPNWLSSPAGDHAGGGGPGARPVPANPEGGPAYRFYFPKLPRLDDERSYEPVEVAVLDTAPPCRALQLAYAEWSPVQPVLRNLLGTAGFGLGAALAITYAHELDIDLPRRGELFVKGHDYAMADHGLFVAGIINTIAPRAPIRLIEVLNERGLGDVDGIAAGLEALLNERATRQARGEQLAPLIVNMSLTLVPPGKNHPKDDFDWDDTGEMLSLHLAEVCKNLANAGVMIIAAAGNDSKRGKSRLDARFPAAYDSVLGVGALVPDEKSPIHFDVADYSNQSDKPLRTGIATIGGDATETIVPAAVVAGRRAQDAGDETRETLPGRGILGVYTGEFPQAPGQNLNGWAYWSGTSFAAPVIAGVIAALAGEGRKLADAKQELFDSYVEPVTVGWEIFPAIQTV